MVTEGRDGYRDQIVTCDVGVSLHSKTHPLFMKCGVMAQVHSVRYTCIQPCFLCFFFNVPFELKEFLIYFYATRVRLE